MALGDGRIHAAKSVAHGATTIASATHFSVATSSVKSADPGPAGSPGLADEQVTDRDIAVTIFARDVDELLALVEAAAANLVLGTYKEAGAAGTITIKNVKFNDPPSLDGPAKDSGAPAGTFSISGRAQWAAEDTWALMLVLA